MALSSATRKWTPKSRKQHQAARVLTQYQKVKLSSSSYCPYHYVSSEDGFFFLFCRYELLYAGCTITLGDKAYLALKNSHVLFESIKE